MVFVCHQTHSVWSLDTVEVSSYYAHFYTLCPSGSLYIASKWSTPLQALVYV